MLLCQRAGEKIADCVCDVIIKGLNGQPLYSITTDRSKKFAKHTEVTKVLNGVQFYFPKSRHPWDWGTNKKTNILLREYFPKGDDFSRYSDEYIHSKVDELNK